MERYDEIQSELTQLISQLEATGDERAAGYIAQAKLCLRRAQTLLEPTELDKDGDGSGPEATRCDW